jgi:hypothetical protein
MNVLKNGLSTWGTILVGVMLITGCSAESTGSDGETSTSFAESGIGSQGQLSPDEVAQGVSTAYSLMGQSIANFLNTPVDTSNPVQSDSTSANKIIRVREDYDYFSLLVSSLSNDDQLGTNGSPSLAQLMAVDDSVAYWLRVRELYLGEISECFRLPDPYEYINCQGPIFDRYETELVDSARVVGAAIQAVDNSSG